MRVAPTHAAWFSPLLAEGKRTLPSCGMFQPYYNATSWDFNDLMRAFREDAVRPSQVISAACSGFLVRRKWPRLKVEPAFWLRERWLMAARCCLELEEDAKSKAQEITPAEPPDPKAMLEFMVGELWDEGFVDVWLRENARQYVSVDPYAGTDTVVEFEIAMRKFEGTL
jgi:hypothetical protein